MAGKRIEGIRVLIIGASCFIWFNSSVGMVLSILGNAILNMSG